MKRYFVLLFALLFSPAAFAATAPPDPTTAYTDFLRDRQGFSWRLVSRKSDISVLELVSQRWKGSTWKHRVAIYQPQKLRFPDAAALFLTTRRSPFDDLTGRLSANKIGAPFVMVYDVPNQPLWNRTENGLFGYTLGKSIATGEADWSLAFPMAKSAVRAMDAVDAYNARSNAPETRAVKRWLQIGVSKRGLAAWLASTDARVKGLVAIAYNNLNTPQQEKAQLADWGQLSPRLAPYFQNGVRAAMKTPRGRGLINAWDPYFFRARLNKPKLVIDSTGDDYWSLRAFDQYASALPGTTNLLMVAGADHFMVGALGQIVDASAAWCGWTLSGKSLPQPKLTRVGNRWQFAAPGAQTATLHWAWSQNNDFRRAQWQNKPMQKTGGNWTATTPKASAGKNHIAVFATGDWSDGNLKLPLSSRVIIR